MSEFKIERFRYNWKGEWSPGEEYIRDDVVGLSGKTYVCIVGHTSSSTFQTDLLAVVPGSKPPEPAPKWILMTESVSYRGEWEESTEYNLGESATYEGSVFVCSTAHVSTNFVNDRLNWSLFALGSEYQNDWSDSTDYADGVLLKYNGIVYRCIESHTSSSLLENDIDKWTVYYEGSEYRSIWESNREFRKNDIVKFGSSLYRCVETHTSTEDFDRQRFAIEFPGFQFGGEWNTSTVYQTGDIVRFGGFLYYANSSNQNILPTSEEDPVWTKFAESYNFRGEWQLGVPYRTGDVVQRGGQIYVARENIELLDINSSVLDYLDNNLWDLLVPGSAWDNGWAPGRIYSVGDVVYFLGSAYRANIDHVSDETNFPGENGNIFDYWDLVIQAGQPGALRQRSDLISYGLNKTIIGDNSSEGDINVPIGDPGQLLSITENLDVFWRKRLDEAQVLYVAENGVDDESVDRGFSWQKPFRTIKYAAQYIEDNFEPLTNITIFVGPGRFEEIAPIIVPAGCAIVGSELRTTKVEPNTALSEYQDDFKFVQFYLNDFSSFLLPILRNEELEPTEGNTVEQKFNTTTTDINGLNAILPYFLVFESYIGSKLSTGFVEPTMQGSNIENNNQNEINAGLALWENREFIAGEVWTRLKNKFPEQDFDFQRIKNDIYSLLRGIRDDLKFSGNYRTFLAAERYVNAAKGSEDKNLFYVRDTTGIRQLTTGGLKGEVIIGPPSVREYPTVTGGAYVALDPGWGPDDERTWIINRSPYVQGVTTTGTGCVGKRVDGSLHNGGNRSMVSNDFTQVLSDGIGVWVSDGGRTELVSVFTYYCAVGYLAKEGGIIRATNGNNSYGRFGAVADGNDPTETPQIVNVFNRNNEAQVKDAFAGGFSDEIFILEYSNAGQNYTQADADIIGAGSFAQVEFSDFRDGALFEERIINTRGSGQPGGANYLLKQGFAQITEDATNTILLSGTEETQVDTLLLGQRVVIINGPGTGQYGYIAAYDPPRKEATIRRESDNELGWDHIIPGTPIVDSFQSSTQYRIEPRVEVNYPGFSNTTVNLPAARTVIDAVYSNTTEVFENIELNEGSFTDPDLIPQGAVVDITRKGQRYFASIQDGGAGYSVGDSFVILGSNLDGVSPDNDVTITVTQTSDDSSSSILDIDIQGIGRSGRIVALAEPNFVVYSDNGRDWQETILSFVGDYNRIIDANDRFIAIAGGEDRIGFSINGIDWEDRPLPIRENWVDAAYDGNETYVIISDNSNNALYSNDGETWQETDIPEDTVSDSTGDSTVSSYTHVVYGKEQFLAVSTSDRATATSPDGVTWTRHNEVLPDRGSEYAYDIVGLAYGDNRYLLLNSDGVTAYSFDGIAWFESNQAPLPNPTTEYVSMKYYQGVFLAIARDTESLLDFVITSETGLDWTIRTMSVSQDWTAFSFASFNGLPEWFVFGDSVVIDAVSIIQTGKTAKLRADVSSGRIERLLIWDPGSGYADPGNFTVNIIDAQFVIEAETETRLGTGVLAQPDFINRGAGYQTNSSQVLISGDGFADIIPEGNTLILSGVESIPGVGVQIRIDGIFDDNGEDLLLFDGSRVIDLGPDGSNSNTRLVQVQINPSLENEYNLQNGTTVSLREIYSQARITNHDFLDIGTGNFEDTNYPEIYAGGNFFVASPDNEVREFNGGRIFYVSTDQDGNFRGGDLFAVDQATGVITISAEFFDLQGLSELALGGIRLGGSGAVVREFSTDPRFSADSDNVVPTQRATASFLASRLSVGGENIETNRIQSGLVILGGIDNDINTVGVDTLVVDAPVNHQGANGTMISQQLFLRPLDEQ
jgi:hypothetical protein